MHKRLRCDVLVYIIHIHKVFAVDQYSLKRYQVVQSTAILIITQISIAGVWQVEGFHDTLYSDKSSSREIIIA